MTAIDPPLKPSDPVTVLYDIGNQLRYAHSCISCITDFHISVDLSVGRVTYKFTEYGTWWIHGHHHVSSEMTALLAANALVRE